VDVDNLVLFSPGSDLGHGQGELLDAHRAASVTIGDRDASPDESPALLRKWRRGLELLLKAENRRNSERG
jgi:hypothetical protein